MIPLTFSNSTTFILIKIFIVILISIFINYFLRSFINLPNKVQSRRGKVYITVARNVVTLIIFLITSYIVFLMAGVNLTPLLASAGLIGIIAGIGAHSLLDDLIAGFFLILQSQIETGDYVRVGSAGIEGTIIKIGFKNLTLKDKNGSLVIIPNGQINNLTNYTYGKANNFIDITAKLDRPIDEILKIFDDVLKDFKNDKNYKIYDESKVIGISNMAVDNITITTLIITNYSLRGKIDMDFRYRLLKKMEESK